MTILQLEIDYVKSNWISRMKSEITNMQVGDDDTTPLESDTALGNLLDTAIIDNLDESVADQLTWTSKFGITAFIGSTIKEAALFDGANIRSRDLTVQLVKGADQIFWPTISTKITAVNE